MYTPLGFFEPFKEGFKENDEGVHVEDVSLDNASTNFYGGCGRDFYGGKEVVDSEYMLHTSSITSCEYPRSSMTVNSHGCLTYPKAFLRSM